MRRHVIVKLNPRFSPAARQQRRRPMPEDREALERMFPEAARAARDFDESFERVREVSASSSSDIARLADDARGLVDEKGHRSRLPRLFLGPVVGVFRSALVAAIEMEDLWVQGEALGLSDEQLATLEARAVAISQCSRNPRITPAIAMRDVLDQVRLTALGPPPPEMMADHLGLLSSQVRRLGRAILLGPVMRLFSRRRSSTDG